SEREAAHASKSGLTLRRMREPDRRLCVGTVQHASVQPLFDPPGALLVELRRLCAKRTDTVCCLVGPAAGRPLARRTARRSRPSVAPGFADRHLGFDNAT